jgi:rare lipoprotein A
MRSSACVTHPRTSGPTRWLLLGTLALATACSSAIAGTRSRGAVAVEEGEASWYGKPYHGRKTASGEVYDMYAHTAAHRTLPMKTRVRVTNVENGKSTVVRVNDRGPFAKDRVIDVSYAAAEELGFVKRGVARVRVERLE